MRLTGPSEPRGALLDRYRVSLPLLAAGTYAALASTLPARSDLGWGATLLAALGALWLVPVARARRWQGALGVYLFVTAIGLNVLAFSGARSVPAPFRVLGWVAFALTWGGLASVGGAGLEQVDGISRHPPPLEKVLAPRRSARAWPFALLLGLAFGLLGLFLWPTARLAAAKAVLLQTWIVAFGVALLRLGAEAMGDVVLGGERRAGRLLPLVLGFGSVALAIGLASRAAWCWVQSREVEALVAAALAGLLLGAVLRFRRFPRTKIEL
jgi:hypothetical protein